MSEVVFQRLPFLFCNNKDKKVKVKIKNLSFSSIATTSTFIKYHYHYYNNSSPYPHGSPSLSIIATAASSSVNLSGGEGLLTPQPPSTLQEKKTKSIAGVDQDELLDPELLADPDSCFCEFRGVHIHHKLQNAEPTVAIGSSSGVIQSQSRSSVKVGFPMILLHGFGASVFSWNLVLKPLAELTGSKVLAFDRPAFGLTSRVPACTVSDGDAKPLNPYSMAFSVLATLHFIYLLAADKAILVGHSAGSLVAVNTYFEAPERVSALILIAPAIFAPLTSRKFSEGNGPRKDGSTRHNGGDSMLGQLVLKLLEISSKFMKGIAQVVMKLLNAMSSMLNSLYKRALSSFLRSAIGIMLIRVVIDRFGTVAVRNAWCDSKQVTEHVLNGYTKPLKAKGWDRALAEFTAATLAGAESEAKPPVSERLHEISCPVLIVTGDSDRIVPSWNAKRLSQAIPGSHLEIVKHCGHLPHEEKVQEFVSIVERFLQKAFGEPKEPPLPAPA